MWLEMVRAEWARRRVQLGLMGALCLSLPLVPALAVGQVGAAAFPLAQVVHGWLTLVLLVAAATWGSGAWTPERRGRWVYFLSLPVGRVRLFAVRYLAGLFWLTLAVGALAAAAWAAAAAVAPRLPPGLYTYPGPVAAWAALASWFLYTAGFVVAARWEHPGRVLLAPVTLLALCFALAVAGVADEVLGAVLEHLLYADFTPLQALYVPSLIGS